MKTPLILIAAAVLAGAGSLWLAFRAGGPEKPIPSPKPDISSSITPSASPVQPPASSPAAVETASAPLPLSKMAQVPSDAPTETILAELNDAATSYDPKELPRIERFLLHITPEVRSAAVQSMIILGDAAAAPFLREASKKAPTPQEAVSMLEAADYVELPAMPMNLRRLKKKESPATETPK